jgi:uncharacterized protein YbjT (DUF2867 family)
LTGKTGRAVERHLTSHGHEVRAVARGRGVGFDDAVLNAHLRRGTTLGAALMEERLRGCAVPEPIVLRAGWFMENYTDGLSFRAQAQNTGAFRTPFTAHRPMPTVAARDVGQRAAGLSDVRYEQLSYDAARAGMLAAGMPSSFADAVVETARSFNDAQPWALAPRDDETTTSTSLRDWARAELAGVST